MIPILQITKTLNKNWHIHFTFIYFVYFYFVIDFSKLIQQRQLLDGQLNENKSVLEELNLLSADNQVNSVHSIEYKVPFDKPFFSLHKKKT